MEDIIRDLKTAKELIMCGAEGKAIDKLNDLIDRCEELKAVLEAVQDPIPGQGDMLPIMSGEKIVINAAENSVVNVFCTGASEN